MFETILVATDFSAQGMAAVRAGAAWARRVGSKLAILHVDEIFDEAIHDAATLVQITASLERKRAELMEAAVDAARKYVDDERIEPVRLRDERASSAVVEYASAHADIGLIVTGTHSRESYVARLLGGTAVRILRHAPVPVLLVNAHATEAADRDVRRMLYPTDLSDASVQGLEFAADVALAWNASVLDIVHVLEVPVFVPAAPGEPPLPLPPVLQSSRREVYLKKLEVLARRIERPEVTFRVEVGDRPAETIAALARDGSMDLIVIPTHGHSALHDVMLGSTAVAVVELAPCPVLALPGSWLEARHRAEEDAATSAEGSEQGVGSSSAPASGSQGQEGADS